MMLDLRQYYLDNITEDDVYYKFYQLVETIDIGILAVCLFPKLKEEKFHLLYVIQMKQLTNLENFVNQKENLRMMKKNAGFTL